MEKAVRGNLAGAARRVKCLCLAAVMLVAMSVSGCSAGQDKEEDISAQVKKFNDSIEKKTTGSGGNDGIVVGSVNMGMNGEWFAEVMNGIRDAGKDLGVTLEMLDSESDLDKEAENIDKLVDMGVDVLVISPIDVDKTAQSLQKAQDAGIPIITWNTTVNMDVAAAVGVDSTALGGDTGDYVVEYIKTNNLTDVNLYLLTNTSYSIGVERCEGFKDAIQDLIDEGIIHVIGDDDEELLEDASEATTKMLKKNSDVNMIWAWNQSALLGAIEAVKKADAKDVVVMGTDMSMSLAEDMLNDEICLQAVTTQLPYNMGYKAIVNAVKAAKGEEVDKKVLIPLSTLVKDDTAGIKQYIENHKDLVSE